MRKRLAVCDDVGVIFTGFSFAFCRTNRTGGREKPISDSQDHRLFVLTRLALVLLRGAVPVSLPGVDVPDFQRWGYGLALASFFAEIVPDQ